MIKSKKINKWEFKNLNKKRINRIDALILLQFICTTFALIHAWTLQYKSPDNNANFIGRISFTSQDPPWTPPGTSSHPILHLHHFGDWTLGLAYGQYKNPYDPHLAIPSNIPPLGDLIMRFFSIFGEKFSFLMICILTLILWFIVCKHYLSAFSTVEKLAIGLFFIVFALPSIVSFDRGSVHLISMAIIGLAIIQYEKQNFLKALILITIVISFKPYTIVLTLWLLRKREYRLLVRAWLSILIVNLIAMFFFNLNIFEGTMQYFNALSQFTRSFITDQVMNSASLIGFISKSVEGIEGSTKAHMLIQNVLPWSMVLSGLYVILLVLILIKNKIPETFIKILLLSTCSMIAPPSLEYTLVWAPLAAILLLGEGRAFPSDKNKLNQSRMESTIWTLLALTVVIIITPYFGYLIFPDGLVRQNPSSYLYIPLVLLAATLSLIHSFRKSFSAESDKGCERKVRAR